MGFSGFSFIFWNDDREIEIAPTTFAAQKMKFSINPLSSKCNQNPTGEILNVKLHFLCSN